jgi:regulatory protein
MRDAQGREVEPKLAAQPDSVALGAAVKLLAGKRLTKQALAQKLRVRGYAAQAIENAIEQCEDRGFLDDRTFAQLFVKSVLDRKAVGRMRLFQDLRRQGVDAETARTVLDEIDGDEDQRIDIALAKLEAQRPQDGYGQLGRRLERLGFGAPSIARALRRRAEARSSAPDPAAIEECR